MNINTYLNFNGDCEAAFQRYVEVLGGHIETLMRYTDMPGACSVDPATRDKIMHACVQLGGQRLMGTDATPDHPYRPVTGAHVSIHVDSADEAERIFAAFAEGAQVSMPLQETFWAHRFGMLVDRFGTPWMVNCNKPAS